MILPHLYHVTARRVNDAQSSKKPLNTNQRWFRCRVATPLPIYLLTYLLLLVFYISADTSLSLLQVVSYELATESAGVYIVWIGE